jgi:hypothetical protein
MALLPPFFVDCVVALGQSDGAGGKHWGASGFIYGKFRGQDEQKRDGFQLYLVTNRHVDLLGVFRTS